MAWRREDMKWNTNEEWRIIMKQLIYYEYNDICEWYYQ